MEREQIFDAVAAERRRIADLLDALDEDALATPSLCAGWDVKTVAAHLVSVFADSFWTFQWATLRHGGFHHAIDELARRRARTPTAEIARTLRQRALTRLVIYRHSRQFQITFRCCGERKNVPAT